MSAPATPVMDALLAAHTGGEDYLTLDLQPELGDLYPRVKHALNALGCEWDTHLRTHIFAGPRDEAMARFQTFLSTGKLPRRNPLAFFPTPEPVAAEMAREVIDNVESALRFGEGSRVLEPHGGSGSLLRAVRAEAQARDLPLGQLRLHTCELDPGRRASLQAQGFTVVGSDFLKFRAAEPYDVVIANPPFSTPGDQHAWSTHSLHALSVLRERGLFISVLPLPSGGLAGFDVTPLGAALRHAEYSGEVLAAHTFRAAGTLVSTMLFTTHRVPTWRTEPHQGCPNWYVFHADLLLFNERNHQDTWERLVARARNGEDIRAPMRQWYSVARQSLFEFGELLNSPLRDEDVQFFLDVAHQEAGLSAAQDTPPASESRPLAAARGNQPGLL